MAAEGLLPLFHETPTGHMSDQPSDSDDVLAELLGSAGDDLLASLLEPGSAYLGQLSPPFPSPSLSTPPPPAACQAGPADVSFSPTCDGDSSDRSSLNTAHSPYSCSNISCSPDIFRNSPENPGDVMMTSTDIHPTDDINALLESLTTTVSYGGTSSDIKINVDSELGGRGQQSTASEAVPSVSSSSSSRKAATLVLTEEEKQLLKVEGVELPTDMPLTKAEQKHLKRVQRKIKNKLSAQESRKRKKEYVEGLEERIQCCTDTNNRLRQRVGTLETENKTLLQQLERLKAAVAHLYPSKLQAGTLLMVLSLSFSLLLFPWPPLPGSPPSSHTVTMHSRTLLFTHTDEFGNIIDPESGVVVSEHGGLSPKPPYPWTYQSPAFLSAFTDTHKPIHNKRDL